MKNLNYIACTEIDEYEAISKAKYNPSRTILARLHPSVDSDYQTYLNNFPQIVGRPASVYNAIDGSSLRGCYTVSTIPLDDLIKRIIDTQTVDFQHVCGYCLYYPRTTIDHYVPKEEYCEFSVLAKNLLPCCSVCNGIKNRYWRANNQRLFLHLYNDVIPNSRFLFGNLVYNQGQPTIQYHISNGGAIAPPLYTIIETHFSKLRLCPLYSKGISKLIGDVKTNVKRAGTAFGVTPTIAQIQSFILGESADLKIKYGINYWKSIAMDILANDHAFLMSI